MDYTRLIDEFLDAVAKNENPKQHYNYIKVFSIIKNYVIEKNKSLEEMNIKELDELFFTRFTGRADSIKRIVTYCRRYIRWLQTTGHLSFRDAETHILFDLRYYNTSYITSHKLYRAAKLSSVFFSTEEYVDYMSTVFDEKLTQGDNTRYYTDIAVFYLSWLGFTIDEMLKLKKNDFDFSSRTIAGKYISDERMLTFLNKYNQSDTYEKLRKGHNFTTEEYVYNEYEFLKGKTTALNEMAIYNIFRTTRQRINEFNRDNIDNQIENKVDFNNIKKSALFEYIYTVQKISYFETTTSGVALFASFIKDEIPTSAIMPLIEDYNLWVEIRGSL